jgi:hypothetical protein
MAQQHDDTVHSLITPMQTMFCGIFVSYRGSTATVAVVHNAKAAMSPEEASTNARKGLAIAHLDTFLSNSQFNESARVAVEYWYC